MNTQEVFLLSFQEVKERVQCGDLPEHAVIEVVTSILNKRLISLTPDQYTSWCQKLLSVARQQSFHRKEPIANIPPASLLFGRNTDTNENVYITGNARGAGGYHLGNAGTGKSTVIVECALTDAENGNSVFLFDPHGSAIDDFLRRIATKHVKNIILIQPDAMTYPLGINLLARTTATIDEDASRLMDFLDRRWGYTSKNPSWGPNMQNLLQASIYTFLYNPGMTLAELPYLYEKSPWFREKMLENVPQTQECFFIHRYWREEFNLLTSEKKAEWSSPIRNKLNQLLMVRATYLMFVQSHTTIDFLECMNTGKIVLIHLSNIGTSGAGFVGTLLLEELVKAIFKRDPNGSSPYCSVYIDEFQNLASTLFVDALAQTRKYNVWFYLANQFFKQLAPDLQGAVKQLPHQITQRVDETDAQIRAALYARPPEPTYRQQEIERPVVDPVSHVLSSTRSLTDNRVLEFFRMWAAWFKLSRESAGNPGGEVKGVSVTVRRSGYKSYTSYTPHNSHFFLVYDAREIIQLLNTYFYEVSTKSQFLPFPTKLLRTVMHFRAISCEEYTLPIFVEEPELVSPTAIAAYDRLFTTTNDLTRALSEYEKVVRDTLEKSIMEKAKRSFIPKNPPWSSFLVYTHFLENIVHPRGSAEYMDDLHQYHQEFLRHHLSSYGLSDAAYLLPFRDMMWRIEEDKVQDWYYLVDFNENALLPAIKPQVDKFIEAQKPLFENVIREIRMVCELLAEKPIMASTGEHEQVVSGQRSFQDMENEMASLLVNLPNHIAYVRIGTSEESEKPRIGTLRLPIGVTDNELKKRREQVEAQTCAYGTSEQEIEKALQERRIKLGIIKTFENQLTPEKTPTITPVEKLQETKNAANRRTGKPSPIAPALTFTDDFLHVLSHFPYLKIEQILRLLQKTKDTDKNHVRDDLNKRIKEKKDIEGKPILLEVKKAGRPPIAYSLREGKSGKYSDYTEHTGLVNEILVTLALLPTVSPITLCALQHERYFKKHGIPVGGTNKLEPDGLLQFQLTPPFGVRGEIIGIAIEIDRGFEAREAWQEKIEKYLSFASGIYQDRYKLETLTIAVYCAGTNMQSLIKWTEELIKDRKELAGIFLFTHTDPLATDPLTWATSAIWHQPFKNNLVALIEKIIR